MFTHQREDSRGRQHPLGRGDPHARGLAMSNMVQRRGPSQKMEQWGRESGKGAMTENGVDR